jgi:hypothetical protein
MLLPCFKGFETCLFNYFFIFQGYVLNDFLNQYNIIANVTKLQYFTQCSWMFKGNLKLIFKFSKNTQGLWEEHYNRTTRLHSPKIYLKEWSIYNTWMFEGNVSNRPHHFLQTSTYLPLIIVNSFQ